MATTTTLRKQHQRIADPHDAGRTGPHPCPRCGGLLIPGESLGSLDDLTVAETPLWRCVQCGEVLDPVILRNRQADRLHRHEEGR